MVDSSALRDCARQAWEQYDSFEGKDVVVDPSIPILYFGDLEEYAESERKIVTVGLNPSDNEFPDEDERFDLVRVGEGYFNTLNEYFERNPLRSWFSNYDELLQGLDASYYPGEVNTALHTDLCSPLATKETWNGLSKETKADLIETGRPLWKNLINQLEPDLIIASVAYEHIRHLAEEGRPVIDIGDSQAACVITEKADGEARKRPYPVLMWPYRFPNDRTAPIVYAEAGVKPLNISDKQKRNVGRKLGELI